MNDDAELLMYKIRRTAYVLFWINLVPAIVALVVIVLGLILSFTALPGDNPFGSCVLLGLGVYCEWIYYKQYSGEEFVLKKWGWIYSVVLNVCFIVMYVPMIISTEIRVIGCMLIGYPLSFLTASCYGLVLQKRYKASLKTDINLLD